MAAGHPWARRQGRETRPSGLRGENVLVHAPEPRRWRSLPASSTSSRSISSRCSSARAPSLRQPPSRAHRTRAHPHPRGGGRCHAPALPRPALNASGLRRSHVSPPADDADEFPTRRPSYRVMSSAEQLTYPREESAFAALVERHRGELQVHCYRMLGSFEDSEDLVQETFLRAWRRRASFGSDGRSSFRAWLYRIATNACLDVLRSRPRRVLPPQVAAAGTRPRRLRRPPIFRGCSRTPTGCSSRSPPRRTSPGRWSSRGRRSSSPSSPRSSTCRRGSARC